jgi:sulfane dehydrogenase subunit SoxC
MSNQQVTAAGAARPPMDPASGLRRIKLRPHEMSDTITASKDVFVLAHLGIPRIDPAQWRLSIDGLVGEARTLGLDDLKARRKSTVEAVHQCCGNPLEPKVPTRRVVNVRWGGVDLAACSTSSTLIRARGFCGPMASTAATLPGPTAIGT